MEMSDSTVVCLVCGGSELKLFLDLGSTALANKFVAADELGKPDPVYPLRVAFCPECTHVQLLDRVPPHAMFDDYLSISSASETLKNHLDGLSRTLIERLGLKRDDLVVDIGCNDGTLLDAFRRNSEGQVRVLGVDPAKNLAAAVAHLGIDREEKLFTAETAADIRRDRGGARLITATNTFPHIQDLADFVTGLKNLLAPGGVFVGEAHYLIDILDQVAFDTVYHEHVSYWALGPIQRLMRDHGMEVVDVQRLPIHHGQLRFFVQRAGEGEVRDSVGQLLRYEEERGLRDFATYENFATQVYRIRRELTQTLDGLKQSGHRVVGYGAPAKGNTLLTYLNLGSDKLDYICDKSPFKQGRYTPGMHIPVVSPSRLTSDRPEYVLLLAWNFQDEVLQQQTAYRELGGKFITPVPEVRIL
jgi:SAM-dependent methyltransferase